MRQRSSMILTPRCLLRGGQRFVGCGLAASRQNSHMNQVGKLDPRDEHRPKAGGYIGAIFLSGAALWVLLTLVWLIRPATSADVCDNEPGTMCCWWCDAIAWFTIVPFVLFFFSLIFFLPGFLIVRSIARRAPWWRSVFW